MTERQYPVARSVLSYVLRDSSSYLLLHSYSGSLRFNFSHLRSICVAAIRLSSFPSISRNPTAHSHRPGPFLLSSVYFPPFQFVYHLFVSCPSCRFISCPLPGLFFATPVRSLSPSIPTTSIRFNPVQSSVPRLIPVTPVHSLRLGSFPISRHLHEHSAVRKHWRHTGLVQ